MKAVLLTGVALIVCGNAFGQDYQVEFWGDTEMTNCSITYTAPGIVQVHAFLTGSGDATVVQFAGYLPECLAGSTWLYDIVAEGDTWLTIGGTQMDGGWAIAFTECRELPLYLGYMNILVSDVGVACCSFPVSVPRTPSVAYIEVVDCQQPFGNLYYATGKSMMVNTNGACPCETALPVSETTWGAVKALYR